MGLNGGEGGIIANATVTLSNGMTTTTDASSNFVLDHVAPGTYDLTVTKDGYAAMIKSVSATAGETNDLGSLSVQAIDPAAPSSNNSLLIGAVIVVLLLGVMFFSGERRRRERCRKPHRRGPQAAHSFVNHTFRPSDHVTPTN